MAQPKVTTLSPDLKKHSSTPKEFQHPVPIPELNTKEGTFYTPDAQQKDLSKSVDLKQPKEKLDDSGSD